MWQDIVGGGKVIFSNGKTACGFIVVLVFVLVAIFGSMIFPYNPDTDVVNKYLDPSWEHPFGTDWLGRDVFRQMIAGTSSVLEIAFFSAIFTVAIGTVLGILSGYVGGWVDKVIMGVTNIFLSVPAFPVYLLLAAIVTIDTPLSLAVVEISLVAPHAGGVGVELGGFVPLGASAGDELEGTRLHSNLLRNAYEQGAHYI